MAKQNTESYSILNGVDVELIFIKNEDVYIRIMEYSEAVSVLQNTHPTIKKKEGWIYKIYQLKYSQFKNAKVI